MSNQACTVTIQMECRMLAADERGSLLLYFSDPLVKSELPALVEGLFTGEIRGFFARPFLSTVGMTDAEDAIRILDPEEAQALKPDRRWTGHCRRFRFTHETLLALPPHRREYRASQSEYRDTVVSGLCILVGRNGRKYFYFRFRFRGRKRIFRFGEFPAVSLKDARNRANEAKGLLAQDIDPTVARSIKAGLPLLREFVEQEYMPYAKQHKRSWRDDEIRLNKVILPRFGAYRIDEVTTREVQQFHTSLSTTYALATANRYLAVLRRLYSLANQWEIYGCNPAKNVKLFRENNARERYLSKAEIDRLLTVLDELPNRAIGAGLKFLLFTGLRKNEAFRLEWKDIDRERGTAFLARTKNGKKRTVILNTLARGVIEEMWAMRPDGHQFVFPGRHLKKPVASPNKLFKEVCEKAGIEGVRIHDLRHSFASLAINSGASLYDVQHLLGHTTSLMTQRYAHLEDKSIRHATEQVALQIAGRNGNGITAAPDSAGS